jgi:hypothetical protein
MEMVQLPLVRHGPDEPNHDEQDDACGLPVIVQAL